MSLLKRCGVLLILSALMSVAQANQLPWPQWVAELRVEAISQGIQPQLFDRLFAKIPAPSRRVMHF